MIEADINGLLRELRSIVNEPVPEEPEGDAWSRGYGRGYERAMKALKLAMTKNRIAVAAE